MSPRPARFLAGLGSSEDDDEDDEDEEDDAPASDGDRRSSVLAASSEPVTKRLRDLLESGPKTIDQCCAALPDVDAKKVRKGLENLRRGKKPPAPSGIKPLPRPGKRRPLTMPLDGSAKTARTLEDVARKAALKHAPASSFFASFPPPPAYATTDSFARDLVARDLVALRERVIAGALKRVAQIDALIAGVE